MLKIRQLIWDDWNVKHIAKHKMTPDEADKACRNEPIFAKGKKGRIIALGYGSKERLLTVVLDPTQETGTFYPVSVRPASRKERRYYKTKKGGENATA